MKKSKLVALFSGIGAALTASAFIFTISGPNAIERLIPENYTFFRYRDGKVILRENMPLSIGLKGAEYNTFSVKRSFFDMDDDGRVDTIVNSFYNNPTINIEYNHLQAIFQYGNVDSVKVLKRSLINEGKFIEADSLLKRIKEKTSGFEPTERAPDYDSWDN